MTQRARRTGTPNQGRDLLDFPLAGRLFWHDGRAFGCIESSSRKGKRYRYYTAPSADEPDDSEPHPENLPCAALHEIVIDQLRQRLRDPPLLLDKLLDGHRGEPVFDRDIALAAMKQLDDVWGMFIDKTQAQLMLDLVEQVTLYPDQMQIRWSQNKVGKPCCASTTGQKSPCERPSVWWQPCELADAISYFFSVLQTSFYPKPSGLNPLIHKEGRS